MQAIIDEIIQEVEKWKNASAAFNTSIMKSGAVIYE